MEPIKISGIELLNEKEREITYKLLDDYFGKMKKRMDIELMKVHFKEHNRDGRRKRYDFHIEFIVSGDIFNSQASDWSLASAVHKALNKITNEIEHRIHSSKRH